MKSLIQSLEPFKVSAGTPIIAGENVAADTFDGCPNKNASFTFKNNGIPDPLRPEVSVAYNVDLSVGLGGNITISSLVFLV